MPNPTIDQAFVQEFEAGVHEAYQRKASIFSSLIRSRSGVKNKTRFQKYAAGVATTKARNAAIPPMNNAHTYVDITTEDWYAGDFIDDLDLLRIEHDEMMISMNAGAYALGRKTDELIVTAAATSTSTADETTNGATLAWATTCMVTLGNNDAPDDGDRYAVIGWAQWGKLMALQQFSNSQYVGADELPFKNATQAKKWMGFTWLPWSGYTRSTNETNYVFHKGALAIAIGADVDSRITYEGTRAAWWALNKLQKGAGLIDTLGVLKCSLKVA